ncbi:flagellar biosynthetic protein FliO [Myxococcota bacterium]|nr:flagellar biosynthetic protein FliO [Myxococcota bacterium]
MMTGWTLLQQASPEGTDIGAAAWRALLVLLVLIGLLIVVARYGRQWLAKLSRATPGEMTVRSVCPLEPRRALYLVRLRDRDYLIASSEGGLTLLKELEATNEDKTQ